MKSFSCHWYPIWGECVFIGISPVIVNTTAFCPISRPMQRSAQRKEKIYQALYQYTPNAVCSPVHSCMQKLLTQEKPVNLCYVSNVHTKLYRQQKRNSSRTGHHVIEKHWRELYPFFHRTQIGTVCSTLVTLRNIHCMCSV